MLIKKLHKNRQKLATCVLSIFSIVFLCDFACDFEIIKSHAFQANESHDHEVVINDYPSHHTHEHGATLPINESHDHDKSSDEDCCEEETNQFYASLLKRELPVFDLDKVVVTLAQMWRPTYNKHYSYKETNPNILNNALPPPASGMNACIIFQLFLC